MKITKPLLLLLSASLLTGCGFLFDKDNTPEPNALTDFRPEVKPRPLWTTRAGSGAGSDYLKMGPALSDHAVYAASNDGTVTSIDKNTGRVNWRVSTRLAITSTPGVGDGIVVVGSQDGHVMALSDANGGIVWNATVPGEVLSQPAVSRGNAVIKTVDGYVRALSVKDGHERWSFQQVEPNLILRGSSSPAIYNGDVVAGFANGNLAKLTLDDGQLLWTQPVATPEGAFTIERMIDIDADPILFDRRLYAATYQGNIASLDWYSGRILWSHKISSYTGMAVGGDSVYVSDARSQVWGFNADSGLVNWRQTDLEWRNISGPAVQSRYVVVGDAQGYLHWLNRQDGHMAARVSLGSAIYAAPVAENGVIYALTNKGYLAAYTLG